MRSAWGTDEDRAGGDREVGLGGRTGTEQQSLRPSTQGRRPDGRLGDGRLGGSSFGLKTFVLMEL